MIINITLDNRHLADTYVAEDGSVTHYYTAPASVEPGIIESTARVLPLEHKREEKQDEHPQVSRLG